MKSSINITAAPACVQFTLPKSIRNACLIVCLCGTAVMTQTARGIDSDKSDEWYRSEEGRRIAANILSYQDDFGGWPKNIDTRQKSFEGDRKDLHGTFDNGASVGEMRFLGRAFKATGDVRYKAAFLKGLDLILKAQYPTGGWPQYYPPSKSYHRYITYNDNTMIHLMELLRQTAISDEYDFLDAEHRQAAKQAFDGGIECILKCQIYVNGTLTAWCAQHDDKDYQPRSGRAFEPASLSGGESYGILHLLMSLDNPSSEVTRAITAGVNWYRHSKVEGIRVTQTNGETLVVRDPEAPTVWARFYEIHTNRPIFCGRDGICKYDFNEIESERRSGYAWYGNWGEKVFRDYEKWLKQQKIKQDE